MKRYSIKASKDGQEFVFQEGYVVLTWLGSQKLDAPNALTGRAFKHETGPEKGKSDFVLFLNLQEGHTLLSEWQRFVIKNLMSVEYGPTE